MFSLTKNTLDALASLEHKKVCANQWVYGDEGKVYVRLSRRVVDGKTLQPAVDVATIEVDEEFQRQGVCTQLLIAAGQYAQQTNRVLFVESVITPHLITLLEKQGFEKCPHSEPPSFYKSFPEPSLRATPKI